MSVDGIGKHDTHRRSLMRLSKISPTFKTYILSLLFKASMIWRSTSVVMAVGS
jgi:hypothetical protein